MKLVKALPLLAAVGALAACEVGPDKTRDNYIDSKNISTGLVWGVWVDPDGCDHWIADNGVEGHLATRLDAYGKPVCSGVAPPTVATGPFKEGSNVPDLM